MTLPAEASFSPDTQFDLLFTEFFPPEENMCLPLPSMSSSDSYATHVLGREFSSSIYVPAMLVGTIGQFRMNYAIAHGPTEQQNLHGNFVVLYDPKTPVGRTAQQFFLPADARNRPLTASELEALRINGARLQTAAGLGMQGTQAIRLGIDLYALSQTDFDAPSASLVKNSALAFDASTLAVKFLDGATYNVGLSFVGWRSAASATPWLTASHRLGVAGGILQIASGGMRLTCEVEQYLENGEFNSAIVLYSGLDIVHGATGTVYSWYVLSEAHKASSLTGQTNALMNIVKLTPRMQWGLRAAGTAGAAFGFAVNVAAYYGSSRFRVGDFHGFRSP